MRIIIIFDLPSTESEERKEYTKFHNTLIRNGYIMIQFSVYMKPFNRHVDLKEEVKKFKLSIPKNGNIRAMAITEYQWNNSLFILGEKTINEYINNTERYTKI